MPGIRIPYCFRVLIFFLGVVSCFLFSPPTTHAEDFDPFNVESGHWMSFGHYDDNLKSNRPVSNETLDVAPVKIATPELEPTAPVDTKPTDTAAVPAIPTDATNASSTEPAIASLTRPVDLPVLPGVNKGYNLNVTSTLDANASDTNASTSAVNINQRSGEAEMHLREQNWQDAAEIARQHSLDHADDTVDNERLPLDVRMSFLPNPKISPVTASQPTTRRVVPGLLPQTKPAPEAVKTADCKAVDDYKKKQLEAIQSDRQTLQALQAAISDLGLQKELNFLAGSRQSRTLTIPQIATP